MKFDHFQQLLQNVFPAGEPAGKGRYSDIAPERLPSLVLAYIGDAVFNVYVRTRLLNFEQGKVRVLHTFGAKIVSAAFQAVALRSMESELTEAERDIVRRGRNAKSTPTKNASVGDYRSSTGFEALLGYLYLRQDFDRLYELCERAFVIISGKLSMEPTKQ